MTVKPPDSLTLYLPHKSNPPMTPMLRDLAGQIELFVKNCPQLLKLLNSSLSILRSIDKTETQTQTNKLIFFRQRRQNRLPGQMKDCLSCDVKLTCHHVVMSDCEVTQYNPVTPYLVVVFY